MEEWKKDWNPSKLPARPVTVSLHLQRVPQYKVDAVRLARKHKYLVVNIVEGLWESERFRASSSIHLQICPTLFPGRTTSCPRYPPRLNCWSGLCSWCGTPLCCPASPTSLTSPSRPRPHTQTPPSLTRCNTAGLLPVHSTPVTAGGHPGGPGPDADEDPGLEFQPPPHPQPAQPGEVKQHRQGTQTSVASRFLVYNQYCLYSSCHQIR